MKIKLRNLSRAIKMVILLRYYHVNSKLNASGFVVSLYHLGSTESVVLPRRKSNFSRDKQVKI